MTAPRKLLGRIKSVRLGHVGYQDAMLGVAFELGGDGWGVMDSVAFWSPALVKHSEHCQWTDGERDAAFAKVLRRIDELLAAAKVDDLNRLVGKPVEVTFRDFNTLDSWRLLTEVL